MAQLQSLQRRSIYTMKGDQFSEAIVDRKSGTIKKTEQITERSCTPMADADATGDHAERAAMIVPRLVLAGFGRRTIEVIVTALVIAALSAVVAVRVPLSKVLVLRSASLNERSVQM